MTTASVSAYRSGNVLDLNAYRQQREAALYPAPEEAWEELRRDCWEDEVTDAAPARQERRPLRFGEVMDVAASAAMVVSALVMAAVVLL